jgi:predicted GNAT family N-acyltransferase
MTFRNILKEDYEQYIKLIGSNISREDYNDFIDNVLGYNHIILVLKNENNIVGTGTLFIENKLTYGGCRMGHIENVLIDPNNTGLKYGEKLVKKLLDVAKEKKCYRVDLNCNKELDHFYEKNGFGINNICMNVYFKENFK